MERGRVAARLNRGCVCVTCAEGGCDGTCGQGRSVNLGGRTGGTMATTMATAGDRAASVPLAIPRQPKAPAALAVMRLTIGVLFIWVFFENLGKGLYSPSGYAGLINNYIQNGSAPTSWKSVMAMAANHAGVAAPLQAGLEISLGIVLVLGLLTRPAAFVAFLYLGSLWVSEWGTAWIWELLVPVLASLGLAVGSAGRKWGIDAWLAQRWPSAPWW